MLRNRTPYAAERNWIRDKHGVHHWLVAVSATFDLQPSGRLRLADEQSTPEFTPEYRGKPGASSLRLDSDLVTPKPSTDVVVEAYAHAPKHKPATTVPVSLRVAELEKTLLVHGTRVYYRGALGLAISSPQPFTKSPIHYEVAFGGVDASHEDPSKHRVDERNPIGRGFTLDPKRVEHQQAHAIEYPTGDPAKRGPAGFGPIDRWWSPRRELAGTYDERWNKSRSPLLPLDYDERFGLSAPADQRPARALRGGERIALTNMSPSGSLIFELPKIAIGFRTWFGAEGQDHRATLTTVFIAAEELKLKMIWQSTLQVSARAVEYLDGTTIWEKRYIS